jgi:hypothetical protein
MNVSQSPFSNTTSLRILGNFYGYFNAIGDPLNFFYFLVILTKYTFWKTFKENNQRFISGIFK